MRDLSYSDERYVRLYRTDTPDWNALSWSARGLYCLLRRIADRAGIIRVGRLGRRGVAAAVHAAHDTDAVLAAYDELERDGWVEFAEAGSGSGPCLVMPEFIESEEAQASDAARQRAKRERERDKARAAAVRTYSGASENNLSRQRVTHDVTPARHAGGHASASHHHVTQEHHSVPSVPSGDPDLLPQVVAALPSFARGSVPIDDDFVGPNQDHQIPTPPPTARSVPAPAQDHAAVEQKPTGIASQPVTTTVDRIANQILPLKTNVVAPPMPAMDSRKISRRPRYESQWITPGVPLLDPNNGKQLVLAMGDLTAEEAAAERARCLAAIAPPEPTPPPTPKRATVHAVATPPMPIVATPEDPEQAMRAMLAAAPAPICLLADRSFRRLASVLVGTSTRATDIPPALAAAALKLDPKFERLTAASPEHELEELHRFVAGFVGRAHMHRPARASAPMVSESSESGNRLLKSFLAAYRKKFGRPYAEAADDPQHAATIAAELGKRLEQELEDSPDIDPDIVRKRMFSRLCEQWLGDRFAEQCGYALRQLARLLVSEPNRFRLDAEVRAHGASGVAPDISPVPQAAALSPEDIARINATIAQIGAAAPKEPSCPPT